MSRIFHIWWLVIVAIIAIALIVAWALFSGSQTLSANSLNGAVDASLNYARDKSSRLDRGTYVINRDMFQKRLSEYRIKSYGKVGSKASKPSKLYVHYLIDNSQTDNNSNGNWVHINDSQVPHNADSNKYQKKDGKWYKLVKPYVVNGYINADNYDGKDVKNNDTNTKFIPIRAVQVSAIADGHNHKMFGNQSNPHYSDPNSITNVNNKYVATLVVQNADQNFMGHKNNEKYMNNNQNPNQNSSDYDDPTMNSFNGTNGNQGLNTRNTENQDD